ncbi:uncharacterized protein LOC144350293 [Saccoglossus kowalevskii]
MKSALSDDVGIDGNESPFFIEKIKAELSDNSHYTRCKRQMSASITDVGESDDSDEFAIFIEKIGAEIDDAAFRAMKRICCSKLSGNKIESMKDPAELISALEEAAVISEGNLDYLSRLLETVNKTKLVEQLNQYQCTHVNSRGKMNVVISLATPGSTIGLAENDPRFYVFNESAVELSLNEQLRGMGEGLA